MVGSAEGPGVEQHDITIGGVTILGVPHHRKSYHLPPGVFASNKFFNKEAVKLGDSGLDYKVVLITDLAAKSPMQIIDALRDRVPSQIEFDAVATPEGKHAL